MQIYREIGELIFGTRLRRISEKFLADITKVYRELDIEFEPSWFPVFYVLNKEKQVTIAFLSESFDVSHSAMSQLVTQLERKNIVKVTPSTTDRRKRLVNFTRKGNDLLKRVLPVWTSVKESMETLIAESENSKMLMLALNELEDNIAEKSIFDRVMLDLHKNAIR